MRQRVLLDELLPLAGGEAQRVAVALQVQEQLGAVIVFPLAGVHRAAPQPDDDGQMLDAHRALELAGAAGGALERRLFAEMCLPSSGASLAGAEFVQVIAHAQDDFFRVETFPVLAAGQCSVQRPHSTHEKACSASMRVTSLPVSRPKSSSPASGGIG